MKDTLSIFAKVLLPALLATVFPSVAAMAAGDLQTRSLSRLYTMENGLSSNRVHCIVQDSLGFIWFGTNDGLNRFDGMDFRKYYYTDGNDGSSMSSNSVRWLMIGSDNRMWIALDNGIDIYDPHSGSFSRFKARTGSGETVSDRVLRIAEDADGEIWIGTMTGGLFRYTPSEDRLQVYRHDADDPSSISQNSIAALFVDSEGVVWAATYDQGVCAFSKKTGKFTVYREGSGGLSSDQVQCIYEDGNGYLWFGTYASGIDRFDRRSRTFANWHDSRPGSLLHHIHDIISCNPGELLVTSDHGAGIFRTDDGKLCTGMERSPTQLPVENKLIYKAFMDREGGLWLGSYFYGAEYFQPRQQRFRSYSCSEDVSSGSARIIKAVSEGEKGIIWVGTDDDGIYQFNTLTEEMKPFRTARDIGASQYIVSDLLCDGGKLFAATYERGLEVFDLKTGKMKTYRHNPEDGSSLPSSRVFVLFKSSTSRIWIGTANGVCHYDRDRDSFVRLDIPGRISDITEDNDHGLWIATRENGLYHYDMRTGSVRRHLADYENPDSLVRNALTVLAMDRKGKLWIGTDGYGICSFDSGTGSFRRYPELRLPNRIVSGIIPDGRILWIATNKGLVRWNTGTDKTRIFSKVDGLYSEQFAEHACLVDYSGLFVFGTTDGICAFSPHNLTEDDVEAPPVVFTSLSIYNRPVSPWGAHTPLEHPIEMTGDIRLAYDQRMFSVGFAALSYIAPEEMLYRYRLEGFDDKWYVTGGNSRSISYSNLPPKKYTLYIECADRTGGWEGSTPAELRITIRPHPLLSPAAWTVYVLTLLLILAVLLRYLVRRANIRHEERFRELELKSQQEIYNAKIDFFTHITHEIRTPLSLIIGPLEQMRQSRTINGRFGEYLEIIEMNCRRLYSLVTQLLDFRKVDSENYRPDYSSCNVEELAVSVAALFSPTARQHGIRLDTEIAPAGLTFVTDREALTKILSNLLSNAVKHAKSSVMLNVRLQEDSVTFTVEDDGEGFAPEERDKIFQPFYQAASDHARTNGSGLGLYISRQLAELLGGSLTLSCRSDGMSGASFCCSLPLNTGNVVTEEAQDNVRGKNFSASGPFPETILDKDEAEEPEIEEVPSKEYTVMLVDDDAGILDFLISVLGGRYFCIAVATGEEALHMLAKNRIDVVISDVMMNGMDGLELCRRIKSDIYTSHIPVILLTAKANLETKIKGLEYGADAYIEKPFSVSHLQAQLANLIVGRSKLCKLFSTTPQTSTRIEAFNRLDQEFADRCTSIITENVSDPDFSVDVLAREMGMSRTSIFVKLKAITGMTPNEFIKLIRLKVACRMMAEGSYRATEVGFLVGFNSSSYFAKCFFRQFGIRPNDYIKTLERSRENTSGKTGPDSDNN